jgi:integrase
MSIRKRKWTTRKGEAMEAWVADYVDQHGERHLKTFTTQKAAKAWTTTALHEIQQGTHTPASASETVEDAWRLWLSECEANKLEFGTIRQRRQHLEHHVKSFIGRMRLANLTKQKVYEFDRKLRENGRSTAMRRKVMTNLKTMLDYAQQRGAVAQNVAEKVRIKTTRDAATGPLRAGVDFPTMSELNALIENSAGRWRPFIITAIFTGMRLSELRGLPWGDVDLDAGIIHVRQRADAWLKIGPTKSKAGKRDIPLPPLVVNTLKQWRAECPKGELDLVFPNTLGNVETMSNIHARCWVPLQIRSGMAVDTGNKDVGGNPEPKYNFHLLRHAAASLFIAYLGWTPKKLQAVMGHASITLTFDLYGHLLESVEADRAAMAKIEAAVRAA